MNERIRELAEQARKYARDYVAECKHYGHYMEHNEYELRFEEKFAELIVKECMAQCDKVEHDDELSNHEGGFRDGALLCYQEIRDHFGVEE